MNTKLIRTLSLTALIVALALVSALETSATELDSDGDGYIDSQDECPNEYGPDHYNWYAGCAPADSDGDDWLNHEDECPWEFGPYENYGCPTTNNEVDSDGDGLPDSNDECPFVYGRDFVEWYAGCAPIDSDGDGLFNHADECPWEYGIDPYGCPIRATGLVENAQ